jgi:signal transduction histidine kinase
VSRPKRQSKRLGLRARVTLAFAAIALVFCAALAVVTNVLVRQSVHHHQQTVDLAQARTNAALLQRRLTNESPNVAINELAQVTAVLFVNGQLYKTPSGPDPAALPTGVRQRLLTGSVVQQRLALGSIGHLVAVAVPVKAGATYIQFFDVSEIDRTLRVLAFTLLAVAAATTVIAGLTGWWMSNRVLQPVGEVAGAAADLASGRLDTRLAGSADPDLAVVAGAFNAMADALQKRIERDAHFASDVSHELRSPLATLANATQVLATRREELSERSQTALDLLVSEVERFQRLVGDLLEMARLDAGVVPVELEDVRVAELVAHAVERVAPSAASLVKVDEAATDLVAPVDKRRLMRVLANLIDNAAHHGAGLSRVQVSAAPGEVLIAVEDQGPGVPVGDRRRIFERFARTTAADRRTSSDGAGLGLALVAEHVAAQRGRVWVEERPGGGARFVVALAADEAPGHHAPTSDDHHMR